MIVALSVGNAHVTIGLMNREKALFIDHADTDVRKTDLEYSFDIMRVFSAHNVDLSEVTGGVVSSVVPQLSLIMATAVERVFHFVPYLVSAKKQHSLKIDIEHPSSLGANLLADAVAVKKYYGTPAVLVDMGTATSIGVLDRNAVYKGGAIVPGLGSGIRALIGGTAALPPLRLTGAETVLAVDTPVCINSGSVYGNAAMIDGMINRMIAELREEAPEHAADDFKIVMTGRLSELVAPNMRHKVILDEALTLKGLSLLYEEKKEAEK